MSDLTSGINKNHLSYILAGLIIFVFCFSVYGAAMEAQDEEWMNVSLGEESWRPYIIGGLILLGAACLFLKANGSLGKYGTWLLFVGVISLGIALYLWWYWYQIIPAVLGAVLSGAAAGWANFQSRRESMQFVNIRRNEKASAPPVNVIIAVAVVVVLPFIQIWLIDRYDLTSTAWMWLLIVADILIGYAGSYALDLHK